MNSDNVLVRDLKSLKEVEAVPLQERNLPTSTYEVFVNSSERFGDKTALRFLLQGQKDEESIAYSYRELLAKITQTANALNDLGISATDTISTLLPNLPQTHFSIWGAEATGIYNPINPLLDAEHIVAILNEAQTKVLITLAPFPNTDLWDKAQQIIQQVPSLVAVLTVDPANFLPAAFKDAIAADRAPYLSNGETRVLDFDQFIGQYPSDKLQSQRDIQPDDIASYFHTGGTTGTPKLAPHSHANEVTCAWQMTAMTGTNRDHVALCGLPLFHVNSVFVTGLAPWLVGAEVLLASPQGYRNPEILSNFWALVERFNVSYFSAVPTILSELLQKPADSYDLSSLQYCICGAAPLAIELKHNFECQTGLVVIEGYGQTEGTCATTCNPRFGDHPVGSVGLRLPYMQVRTVVVDSDGRAIRDCEPNETGVIAISGPSVFKGYKKAEQNTGQWVDDGWFNTGDLGRLSEEGYLWLTGRSKDLIIRGGHNIDPEVIEESLYKHPAVAAAAAVGKPDVRVGELPVCYVQLRENAQTSAEELLVFAKDHINERAAVPKEIYIIDQIPLTAVGKIFKPELRNDCIRRVVEQALARTLGNIPYTIDVETSKKHGQTATIRTAATPSSKESIKGALGGYAFHYEVIDA